MIFPLEKRHNPTTIHHDVTAALHQKKIIERLLVKLTERERQTAKLLMDGDSGQEIAAQLHISQQRVNFPKKKIKEKAKKIIKPDTR